MHRLCVVNLNIFACMWPAICMSGAVPSFKLLVEEVQVIFAIANTLFYSFMFMLLQIVVNLVNWIVHHLQVQFEFELLLKMAS